MKAEKTYTRLTRPLASLGSYRSLWQAKDHLLIVQLSGFSESYQRFRFADIQAVVTRASEFRKIFNGITFSIGALFLFAAVISLRSAGWWGWLIPTGFFFGLGLWNQLLGPTCKVYLVTKVKTVTLPIRRRRTASRFLTQVEPLILQAQQDLSVAGSSVPAMPPPLQ